MTQTPQHQTPQYPEPDAPRILVVHVDFAAGGGAEAYADAVVDQLRQRGFRVSQLDVAGLVDAEGRSHPCWYTRWVLRVPALGRMSLLKYALACRRVPALASQYDLVLGTYGELPQLGQPTIRILHAPVMFSARPEALAYLGVTGKSRLHVLGRQLYATVLRLLAGVQLTLRQGQPLVTIVNSRWTAGIVSRFFGAGEFFVVYPKVSPPPTAAHLQRHPHGFVSIGRIVPNKRLEDAVAIIGKLHAHWPSVHLTIVGRVSSDYARRFVEWAQQFPYVTVLSNASQTQLAETLSTATYGLHTYRHEHFGISVAEMCAAGVVPFVFDGGGVAELVPFDALRFSSPDDAVGKIEQQLLAPQRLATHRQALFTNPVLRKAMDFDQQFQQVLLNAVQRLGLKLPTVTTAPAAT